MKNEYEEIDYEDHWKEKGYGVACIVLKDGCVTRERIEFPYEEKKINEYLALLESDEVDADKHNTFPHNFEFPMVFLNLINVHGNKIPDELVRDMQKACYNHAILSLEGKTAYATPCCYAKLGEVYVLYRCGKIFNAPDFINLALSTLNIFYSGTAFNSNLWEYHALYETYATCEILMMLKRDVLDESCSNIVDSVYDIVWSGIARNFHVGLRVITGPQADVSRFFPPDAFITFLQCATGIKFDNTLKNYDAGVLSKCPDKYLPFFRNAKSDRFNQNLISRGNTYESFVKSRIASNYIQPDFAIGSFNHESFWYGNVNFVGYMKSDIPGKPYIIKMEVLNNGHEFASAELHSVQFKETVIGHINFVTNHGDIHPDLTPTNGIIKTSDLRIRFGITGDISCLDYERKRNALHVKCGDVTVNFKYSYVHMSGHKIKTVLSKEKNGLYFDTVLFESDETEEIDMTELKKAICLFAFNISSCDMELGECTSVFDDKFMISKITAGENELMLKTPYKPDYREYTNIFDDQFINGIKLEQYLMINQVKSEQYEYIATSGFDIKSVMFTDNMLSGDLECFRKLSFDNIVESTEEFFENLEKYDYTLDRFKRHSTYALKAIFEFAKNHNYEFENIISNSYFDIFQNINFCSAHDSVKKIIVDVSVKLRNSYITLNSRQRKMSTTNRVIDIIAKNYQNPDLSLGMVSEMIGISESYITRVFKHAANTTYVKYVIRIRMEKAKELLLRGYTQEETIKQVGYLNVSSFKRAFKNYSGMTVSEWLKTNK